MAASYVGIIYSARQKVIRRILVPDTDAILDHPSVLLPGELMRKIPLDLYNSFQSPDDLTANHAAAVGPLLSDRCVAINSQRKVQQVVFADPSIDKPPTGMSIVENATAVVGDRV